MWLTFTEGTAKGRSVQATGDRFVVGRDPSCDLTLDDARASRRHAYLRVLPDGSAELHDLDSANGTWVNGHKLTGPVTLSGGEELKFGDTVMSATREPVSQTATVVGEAPPPVTPPPPRQPVDNPPPPRSLGDQGPTPSVIERIKLRRTTRWSVVLGALAVVIAGVAVVLAVTGVFSSDDDEPTAKTIPEIVDAVRPSTVAVTTLEDGQPSGSGTGWVLDAEQGLIVTNNHVVNGGTGWTVGVDDDQREATLVGAAPCEDLALLQVADRAGLVTLPLGDQMALRQGQTVIAVGFPGTASERDNLTTTTGVVSVVNTRFDRLAVDVPQYPNVIQTDAAINPGNSGGPLVNEAAELVGVNSAGITLLGSRTIQGQGYAIGVDRVKEIIPTLRSGRSIGWTGMGFIHVTDPAEVADQLAAAGLPASPGLVVTTAVPGSPAAEAGFGQGPVLVTAVNGQPMDGSLPSYCAAIGSGESGTDAVFTVAEPNQSVERDVTVRLD
ncbi:MAG: trypsin-like peptidase domain-containing protein [Thermoleophilia bacterium]